MGAAVHKKGRRVQQGRQKVNELDCKSCKEAGQSLAGFASPEPSTASGVELTCSNGGSFTRVITTLMDWVRPIENKGREKVRG